MGIRSKGELWDGRDVTNDVIYRRPKISGIGGGMIENLLKLIESGKDSALVRFGLGNAYLKQNEPDKAAKHLERAVAMEPGYSAAWKLLGKAWQAAGDTEKAVQAYRRGIGIATKKGDIQAAKEMTVFLKRAEQPGK